MPGESEMIHNNIKEEERRNSMKKIENLERAYDFFRPSLVLGSALGMDLKRVIDQWYDYGEISYIERDYFKERIEEDNL